MLLGDSLEWLDGVSVTSRIGRVGRPEGSPPEIENLLEKSGVIFQRYILSERRQKTKIYLVKNCEKVNFP